MVANPRQQVRVRGANVPMNTEEPPEDEGGGGIGINPRPPSQWGTPDTGGGWGPRGITPIPPSQWAAPQAGESLGFGGNTPSRKSALDIANELEAQRANQVVPDLLAIAQQNMLNRQAEEEVPAGLTASEWLAQNAGTFDETPYRNYMDFLATQDAETMARINALYNELASEAEANMQRINDIYGSAQMTSGDVYGGAAQNIEGAYGSAQQQAADQMARLGIEAAAPAVINPMALSQAEAVAGVESAGAGALDALNRYGSTAQGFGSQMAQVAQQQGLEVSNQILRDMAQRQAEAVFQMEQARANYNPYANAMQQLEFEQMYNEPMLRGAEREQDFAFEMAKEQVRAMAQYDNEIMSNVIDLMGEGYTYDEAIEMITNTRMYSPYQQ